MTEKPDMIVIGAGPAGIAAALEGQRLGLTVRILSDGPVGGLANAARRIDNLPDYPTGISGREWSLDLHKQLEAVALIPESVTVLRIDGNRSGFFIRDALRTWQSRTVVVAVGTRPRRYLPELPCSPRIHRDVTNLPDDLTGLTVAVVGSGEAAMDSAMNLSDRGAFVRLFSRSKSLKGNDTVIREFDNSGLTATLDASLWDVRAEAESIMLRFDGCPDWEGHHALFCIGRESRLDEIYMNESADMPGMFFAGDILREHDRYVTLAMEDGRYAACMAEHFLKMETSDEGHRDDQIADTCRTD